MRIGPFCMRRKIICAAPNQHLDRLTHSKIFLKIFFKNFPVCTPEMCSGYVRRRKRTSSNLQEGGMRHDVSLWWRTDRRHGGLLHQDGGSEFQQKSQTGKGKRGETLLWRASMWRFTKIKGWYLPSATGGRLKSQQNYGKQHKDKEKTAGSGLRSFSLPSTARCL